MFRKCYDGVIISKIKQKQLTSWSGWEYHFCVKPMFWSWSKGIIRKFQTPFNNLTSRVSDSRGYNLKFWAHTLYANARKRVNLRKPIAIKWTKCDYFDSIGSNAAKQYRQYLYKLLFFQYNRTLNDHLSIFLNCITFKYFTRTAKSKSYLIRKDKAFDNILVLIFTKTRHLNRSNLN